MRTPNASLLLLAFGLLPGLASAQTPPAQTPPPPGDEKPKRPYIPFYGASVGFQQVLSSSARDRFGNSGISFSPGFGPAFAKPGLLILPGFSILTLRKDEDGERNKAFLLAVGPSFRYGFSKPFTLETVDGRPTPRFKLFSPYVEVGPRLVYADVSDHTDGFGAKRLSYGGSFTLGTSVTKNAFIEAKLRVMPKIESYNFSTVGVEFGLRF